MSNLETAIAVAAAAHMDQKDERGNPFILHPLRVMLAQDTVETQIVGVMHDMIERTDTSLNDVYSFGFDDDIVLALNAITMRDDEEYLVYIKRACANPIVRPVKIAELRDEVNNCEDEQHRVQCAYALKILGETP